MTKRTGKIDTVEISNFLVVATVRMKGDILALMEKHDLSDAMVVYMAKLYGGEYIANPQMERPLIRRGIRVHQEGGEYDGSYRWTVLGRQLYRAMFDRHIHAKDRNYHPEQ